MKIKVVLSSSALGQFDMVNEHDFDIWTRYVTETIESATGIDVCVEQGQYGDCGEDIIIGASEEERETLRQWLSVDGWEAFCAGAWQILAANG